MLAYRALVPLYKIQNQIHPAPQAKILRICTSKCKILPAPQAKIFADLHFSNANFYRKSTNTYSAAGEKNPDFRFTNAKFYKEIDTFAVQSPQNFLDSPPRGGEN